MFHLFGGLFFLRAVFRIGKFLPVSTETCEAISVLFYVIMVVGTDCWHGKFLTSSATAVVQGFKTGYVKTCTSKKLQYLSVSVTILRSVTSLFLSPIEDRLLALNQNLSRKILLSIGLCVRHHSECILHTS